MKFTYLKQNKKQQTNKMILHDEYIEDGFYEKFHHCSFTYFRLLLRMSYYGRGGNNSYSSSRGKFLFK
jgi:hypothetical protein